jgi:hypothetical protein
LLRNSLGLGLDDKAKEKKFCQIRNLNNFYHKFTVPLLAEGEVEEDVMQFNTEEKQLTLHGFGTRPEEIKIEIKKSTAELTIKKQSYEFNENDSCFYLLKKIESFFPEKCSKKTHTFNYHYLTKNREFVTKEKGIDGVIKLKDLDNIKVNGLSKFKFKHFNDADHLPYYEDNFLNVYLTDIKNGDNYEAYVLFRSKECLKRIRDKLLSFHSCSYDDGNNSLVYYDFDLQNTKVGRVLGFFLDSGCVKVYYTGEDIIIHDIKLEEDEYSEQEWLYIKGVVTGKSATYNKKKYLVNIKNNSVCRGKFDKIRDELFSRYVRLAEKGIFYFLRKTKPQNDLMKVPAVAVVKLEKNEIFINDLNTNKYTYVEVEEEENSLILPIYGEDIIYHNGCEDCFRIFTKKLAEIRKRKKPKQQHKGDSKHVKRADLENQSEEKPKQQHKGDSKHVKKADLENQSEEEKPKQQHKGDSREKKIFKNTNGNSEVEKEGKHKEKEHPKPHHEGVSKAENKTPTVAVHIYLNFN